jgi:hypothetical protein
MRTPLGAAHGAGQGRIRPVTDAGFDIGFYEQFTEGCNLRRDGMQFRPKPVRASRP